MDMWYRLKNPNDYGYVLFSISQGHNQNEIKLFAYDFVKHLSYFVECAAALNGFFYLFTKSCL